jgi:RNA polymerase sigma-70 factor (ECF subfamily)
MTVRRTSVHSGRRLAVVPPCQQGVGALISRIACRDQEALAALYDATAAQVNGLALRILGDRGAAEEVTADVYLQVWRQAERYDPARGAPLSWMLTMARSRAIDRRRAAAGVGEASEPLRRALEVPSDAPGPEESSAVAERRRAVRAALSRLAAAQRRALELAYFGGLSHSEIAAALGEPLGTVKARIRIGMTRLREILGAAARECL